MSTNQYNEAPQGVETQFLARLYANVPAGQYTSIVSTANWAGAWFSTADRDGIAAYAARYANAEGVYMRVCPVATVPEKGRGTAGDSSYVPALWSDIDLESPVHKSQGVLPKDIDDAKLIVAHAGLPTPNLWVSSGHGVYPYWIFDAAVPATDEIARLSEDVHKAIEDAAKDLDMEVAPMGDLARVLRLPGTLNRKLADDVRPCTVVEDLGTHTSLDELRASVPEVSTATIAPSPTGTVESEGFLSTLPEGPMCGAMRRTLAKWTKELESAPSGSRHLYACKGTRGIITVGNYGHAGAAEALEALYETFVEVKGSEIRDGEWEDIVDSAARKTALEEVEERHCCNDVDLTDSGIADQLALEELTDQWIWSKATGWMRWTGKVWEMQSDDAIVATVQDWLKARNLDAADMYREALRSGGSVQTAEALMKGWKSARSASRITGIVKLARSRVVFNPVTLDSNPDLLNCPNGVVDLRTGELLPHDPAMLMAKITKADYNPNAESKDFDKIMSAIQPDQLDWFQVKVGNGITGYPQIGDDPNVVMQGGGMNAKTTTLDAFSSALGSYAATVPTEIMTGERNHNEMMELFGARFAVSEELPEGARINSKALKKITDTGTLQGCYKFKDTVTWKPSHTLFITTNPIPQVSETTHAVWRRLALMVFPYTYVKEDRPLGPMERKADPTLRTKVFTGDREILEAALAWAVEGAKRFYEEDKTVPAPPESIRERTKVWRMETDFILAYWNDGRIEADPESCILAEDLYQDFTAWRDARGDRPMSLKSFSPAFKEHQATTENRVVRVVVRTASKKVSRPANAAGGVKAQATVWQGVRFVESAAEGQGFAQSDDPNWCPFD